MENKTVFITGASTGIGKATALLFHQKGWNVAATMRKPNEVNDLPASGNMLKLALDVLDKTSIAQAVEAAVNKFGKIDALINNAGYAVYGPLEEATDEQIERQFKVNIFGLIDVTKAVLPHMRKQKSGVIVNIGSVGGKITTPLGSLYHSTKFALEGLSESINYELNLLGIKVRIVEPGGVKTDFAGRSMTVVENNNPDYQTIMDKMQAAVGDTKIAINTPAGVARVIYRATVSKGKRIRYVAGGDAKFMLWIKSVFGPRAVMSMMRKMFKL